MLLFVLPGGKPERIGTSLPEAWFIVGNIDRQTVFRPDRTPPSIGSGNELTSASPDPYTEEVQVVIDILRFTVNDATVFHAFRLSR